MSCHEHVNEWESWLFLSLVLQPKFKVVFIAGSTTQTQFYLCFRFFTVADSFFHDSSHPSRYDDNLKHL